MRHAGLVIGRGLGDASDRRKDFESASLSRLDDDLRRGFDLAIAETANDFEDFAPSWERSAAAAFVGVHGIHEFDFVERIVALASGRINFTSALGLAAWVAGAAFDSIRRRSLRRKAAAVGDATIFAQTLFDGLMHFQSGGHNRLRERKAVRTEGLKKVMFPLRQCPKGASRCWTLNFVTQPQTRQIVRIKKGVILECNLEMAQSRRS